MKYIWPAASIVENEVVLVSCYKVKVEVEVLQYAGNPPGLVWKREATKISSSARGTGMVSTKGDRRQN